jgi:hypothetical protein
MTIRFAHLRTQGIDFAVFECDAPSRTQHDREKLLADLVDRARTKGLKIEKAALTYRHGSREEFFGSSDLVAFLSRTGVPQWTHTLTV